MTLDNENEEDVAEAMTRVIRKIDRYVQKQPKASYATLVNCYRTYCQEEGLSTDFQGWTSELDDNLNTLRYEFRVWEPDDDQE